MENLLLSFAEQLMRYKGMLWIDGEPNRLLFQGVQRLLRRRPPFSLRPRQKQGPNVGSASKNVKQRFNK
uniref:GTP-binding protein n=1 Tax=Klebsiella pneumoniae TaxID=573 RepID=UPI00222857B3|nr:GTP-binding protein [Klebsiella pneumoniae]